MTKQSPRISPSSSLPSIYICVHPSIHPYELVYTQDSNIWSSEIPGSMWKIHCAYLSVRHYVLKAHFSCCHDKVTYFWMWVHILYVRVCGKIIQAILFVIKVVRSGHISDYGQRRIFFIPSLDNGACARLCPDEIQVSTTHCGLLSTCVCVS